MTPKHIKPSMIPFGLLLFIADRMGGYKKGGRVKRFWGGREAEEEERPRVQGERRVNWRKGFVLRN